MTEVAPCVRMVLLYPGIATGKHLPPFFATAGTDCIDTIPAGTHSIEWIDLGQGRGTLQGLLGREIVHLAVLSLPFEQWKVTLEAARRRTPFAKDSVAGAPEGVPTAGAGVWVAFIALKLGLAPSMLHPAKALHALVVLHVLVVGLVDVDLLKLFQFLLNADTWSFHEGSFRKNRKWKLFKQLSHDS